jgi:hypothetical protein
MNNQESRKLSTFAAVLLAIFALPALMCAQTAPATTTAAKKPTAVAVKPVATQPKAPTPPAKTVPPVAQTVVQPKTTAVPAKPTTVATPTPKSVATPATTIAAQPVPATKPQPTQAVNPRAQAATTAAGTGTLTWGNVIYTPAGCVHNGAKAVCTFTLANQGNAVTLQAPWQMNTLQFVDDAHVPHIADAAYFVDNYGTRQAQLFVNSGEGGTLIREFPNVNDQVASGEFHLANQVVGGVSVAAPGTIPGQAPAVANTPVQPVQPAATNGTATADPASRVQSGINQVNNQKQKVKSLKDQLNSIWKK